MLYLVINSGITVGNSISYLIQFHSLYIRNSLSINDHLLQMKAIIAALTLYILIYFLITFVYRIKKDLIFNILLTIINILIFSFTTYNFIKTLCTPAFIIVSVITSFLSIVTSFIDTVLNIFG